MEWLTELLAGVWTFVQTPSDFIPSLLSSAAITLSVTVYVRAQRAAPRPRLETSSVVNFDVATDLDQRGDPYDYQALRLEVINKANGTAYDIQVRVEGDTQETVRQLGALRTDESSYASFNWLHVPNPGHFRMTWWEHPRHKMRTEIVAYGNGHSHFLEP